MPRGSIRTGFVALRSGENRPLERIETGQDEAEISSGGAIYTERDMPSLEELLEENEVVFAVLERPVPELDDAEPEVSTRRTPAPPRPSRARVALAAAIASGVTGAGVVLLIEALRGRSVLVNPYVAATVFLGGCVLLLTLAVALRAADAR